VGAFLGDGSEVLEEVADGLRGEAFALSFFHPFAHFCNR
jgi:hypothetical protein